MDTFGDPATPSPDDVAEPTPSASSAAPAAVDPSPLTAADNAALDPRSSYSSPRPSALLLTELSQMTALLRETRGAADQPALMRRLAEDYVELAQSFRRDARDDAPALAHVHGEQAAAAEKAAIALYASLGELLTVRGVTGPQVESVRYYLALEEARAGDVAAARRTASQMLASSPSSAWGARASDLLGRLDGAKPEADAAPIVSASTNGLAPSCKSSFDCRGADVCDDGRCVDPFAETTK
jgi:hypothetical protein